MKVLLSIKPEFVEKIFASEKNSESIVVYVNRGQQVQETIHRAGRPAPGLSYTQDGKPVSDEQICEWIMEF
ncbi:hypothetical protein [Paenibacillus apiarius]|uniref:hypothetical protein n=1 Tax=Paenibacillus apiarius TaxID=46240 RepID=UPI003B3B76AC